MKLNQADRLITFLWRMSAMSLLLLADMVVMAAPVVMVVMVVWVAGQVAVSSTAESWAFLQSLNLLRQAVFRPCTLSISVLASQELRSDLRCDAKLDYLIGDISRDLLHGKSIGPTAAVIAGFAAIDLRLEWLHLCLAILGHWRVNDNVGAAVFNACAAVLQSFPWGRGRSTYIWKNIKSYKRVCPSVCDHSKWVTSCPVTW